MKRQTERRVWNALIGVAFLGTGLSIAFFFRESDPVSETARDLAYQIEKWWPEVKKGPPWMKLDIDTRWMKQDIPRALLVDKVLGTETRLVDILKALGCETDVLRAENGRHLVSLCKTVFITDDRTLKVLHIAPREMWEKNPELFLCLLKDPGGGQETTGEGGKEDLH